MIKYQDINKYPLGYFIYSAQRNLPERWLISFGKGNAMSETNNVDSVQFSDTDEVLLNLIAQTGLQWTILNVLMQKYLTEDDKELIRKMVSNSYEKTKQNKSSTRADLILQEKQIKYMNMYMK